MRRALEGMAEGPTPFLFFQRLTRRHLRIFNRDVRGGFELNPKEIPLSHLTLRAMDRREHEKERACLQR